MKVYKSRQASFSVVAGVVLLVGLLPSASATHADNSRYFPETGHTVRGGFLDYWNRHGGLEQQGYPITEELQEQSETDGKTYTMQYFERAVFEYHPENQPPYNVLLSLLGTFYYNQKYGSNALNQFSPITNVRTFPETGKILAGPFRRYWESHGGLGQQGYPISNEFAEVSQTDGKTYTVQYFQRAVFELHPEFAGTANEVELSLLGTFYYDKRHNGVAQPTAAPPTPAAPTAAPPTALPAQASRTPTVAGAQSQVLFCTAIGCQAKLLDSAGRLRSQRDITFPPNSYTDIQALEGGYLFAYDPSGRGVFGQVAEDGTYHTFVPTWHVYAGATNVTSFANEIFLYDSRPDSARHVGHLGALKIHVPVDGSFSDLGGFDARPGDDIVTASLDGFVIFYRANGTEPTLLYNECRGVGCSNAVEGVIYHDRPGWTNITRIQNDVLLFYNRNTGVAAYGKWTVNGTTLGIDRTPDFNMGAGWTSITPTHNDLVLAYNKNEDSMLVMRPVVAEHRYAQIWSYGSVAGSKPGWDFVLSTR